MLKAFLNFKFKIQLKTPHFFKAKSRIGLTHKPIRQTELNLGVEDGPDAILTPLFLSRYHPGLPKRHPELPQRHPELDSGSFVDEFVFPNPENILKENYTQVLAQNLSAFKNLINQKTRPDEMQIVVGGENSITFSSLLAVLERVGDSQKLGYIQIDSHGEINSFEASPTKNFHGMYMRPFFDKFDIPEIANLVLYRLDPSQALFIGDLVLDGDEREFLKKMNFKNITRGNFLSNPNKITWEVKKFISKFDFIHINFDIDIFHKSLAGATGIPEDGKWLKNEVFSLLKIISTHPGLSFDLSEVNPKKNGAKRTIKLAQNILELILS